MHARIRSHYIDVALVELEANTSGNCFYEDFNCFVNVWLLGHDYMYHSMPCYNYNHRSSFNKSMNVSTSATKPTRLRRKSSMQHWRSYMNGPPLPLRAWSHLWHVCARSVAASGLDPSIWAKAGYPYIHAQGAQSCRRRFHRIFQRGSREGRPTL